MNYRANGYQKMESHIETFQLSILKLLWFLGSITKARKYVR